MDVLQTTRVVVVDDNKDEGLAIMRAFAKKGIGAAYFDGNKADFPLEDFQPRGIRLLVLDMHLRIGTYTGDQELKHLEEVVGGVLHPANGPFILMAWTKDLELASKLYKRLLKSNKLHPKPIAVLPLDKGKLLPPGTNSTVSDINDRIARVKKYVADSEEDIDGLEELLTKVEHVVQNQRQVIDPDIDQLTTELDQRMAGVFPFDLLLGWEKKVHVAASETIRALSEVLTAELQQAVSQESEPNPPTMPELAASLQEVLLDTTDELETTADSDDGAAPKPSEIILGSESAEWLDEMHYLLRTLVRNVGGSAMKGEPGVHERALLEGLNPIHLDQLLNDAGRSPSGTERIDKLMGPTRSEVNIRLGYEKLAERRREDKEAEESETNGITDKQELQELQRKYRGIKKVRTAEEEDLKSAKKGRLAADRLTRARLNRMLLAAPYEEGLGQGNLYLLNEVLLRQLDLTAEEIVQKALQNAEEAPLCSLVLIDITPACDYAQDKVGLKRMIAGAFAPHQVAVLSKSALPDYHKDYGVQAFRPIDNMPLQGLNRLILNANTVTGLSRGQLKQISPAFRLRSHLVVDIGHWASAHASRPGHTSISVDDE